jgi:hypothetical protein
VEALLLVIPMMTMMATSAAWLQVTFAFLIGETCVMTFNLCSRRQRVAGSHRGRSSREEDEFAE